MTDIKDLVAALQDSAPDPAVKLRQGVVQSVQTGSVTLTIGGSSVSVSGVKYLSSYVPVGGDTVWLATDGRDWIVIGKLGNGSGGTSIVEAMPAGSIIEWGGATAPANWLIADGSAVSRTTYASLYAAIGTTFGAGNGTTTFNLPDLRGRVPVGKDPNDSWFNAIGLTGGEKTHLLTAAESGVPAHNHGVTINDPGHNHTQNPHRHTYAYGNGVGDGSGLQYSGTAGTQSQQFGIKDTTATNNASTTGITASSSNNPAAAASSAHNNMQPYQVVNYIIKYSNGDTAGDSQLTQRVTALEAAPFVRLTRNTSQSIPDSAWTSVAWTAENIDSANMWTSGANITVQKAGVYHIATSIAWSNSTTGSRTIQITKNGTQINADKISPFNGNHWSNLSWIDSFAVGDVILVQVYQNTGAAFTLTSADFAAVWLNN